LGIVDYEDFIQTDASINLGNSGGALVDIEGRLVGINQSIVSRSGGSQGVAFAVPVNLARNIMDRIVTDGKVQRGYLGVNIQPVTPELAAEFKLPNQNGALVGGVQPGTPAAQAGVKAGDVIVGIDNRKVTDPRHLRLTVSQMRPGTKADLKIIREGREKSVGVTLDALPDELTAAPRDNVEQGGNAIANALDGVQFADLDARARRQFDIPPEVRGALVTRVDPDSAAGEAGLRPGDVIVEIGGQPVESSGTALRLFNNAKGERLRLRVWSNAGGMQGTRFVVIQSAPAVR
jgi:serine protease Do